MQSKVPNHIAIIMDGNGRWAKKKGLPRTNGHREGAKRVKEVVREAKRQGVVTLTLFAFSTENWDRPKKERDYLFAYLKKFLNNYKSELIKNRIRFTVFGRRDRIDKAIVREIEEIEKLTLGGSDFFLNIGLDYGGKWDIVNAIKKINKSIQNKSFKEKINEETFKKYLSLADLGDPDILVRTGGEKRISNFLIWQSAYSELYFPEVLWPDFTKEWVGEVIEEYSKRKRTFGRVDG